MNLQYKGTVNIRIGKTKYTVFNTGTTELGYAIALALAGQDVTNRIPKYIDVQSVSSDGKIESILNHKIPFTGITPIQEYNNTLLAKIILNATVLPSDLQSDAQLEDNSTYRLAMLNNDNKELAIYNLSTELSIITALHSGANAVITWTMSISNSTDDTSK